MVRTQFQVVSIKATRRERVCGKWRQQTKVFSQTINPFNKNADGSIKTREDIMAELVVERENWLAEKRV